MRRSPSRLLNISCSILVLAGWPLSSFVLSLSCSAQQSGGDVFFRAGSGEQLVDICRAGEEITHSVGSALPTKTVLEDFKRVGTCQGFIEGVLDRETMAKTDRAGRPVERNFCVPSEASVEELAKVVMKYGDNHPQELHFPAAVIVVLAMKDAFPCR